MNGDITVITGPMKCGKSEELLRRINRFKIADKNVVVVKPDTDRRFSESEVVSRNGKEEQCTSIPSNNPEYILSIIASDTDVIVIDEAQFFDYNVISIVKELSNKNIDVIIGGLDMDSNGHPFGPMPYLMAIADEVIKLKAICEFCKNQFAKFSIAMFDKKEKIVIGDTIYKAACKHCAKKYIK